MKTQNQINLKKAGLTLFALLALTSASMFAAETPESLNVFISAQLNAIIYQAPESTEAIDAIAAMEDLDSFTSAQMASILYKAPMVDETVAVAAELGSLQTLVERTAAEIRYNAPESTEFSADDVTANANEMLACN